MKYLATLAVGILSGAILGLLVILFNPFISVDSLSPLSVSGNRLIILKYSAVPDDAILHTNDGESRTRPRPTGVQELWEPAVRKTTVTATVLSDYQGKPAGIGIKFASLSESTRLSSGEANVDSVWHVYLPGQGSFAVGQRENYFSYLREIVIPAHWSSGKSWKGRWRGNLTAGPGQLRTADVAGGSGDFTDLEMDAVEALTARAYSAKIGPVAIDGELVIELPRNTGGGSPPQSR